EQEGGGGRVAPRARGLEVRRQRGRDGGHAERGPGHHDPLPLDPAATEDLERTRTDEQREHQPVASSEIVQEGYDLRRIEPVPRRQAEREESRLGGPQLRYERERRARGPDRHERNRLGP